MKKEQVSARSGVFNSILNEVNNCVALEASEASEAEVSLIMLDPDVSDETVEFECETEDVVMIAGVSHHEATVRFR